MKALALSLALGSAVFLTACQVPEPTGMRQGTISEINVSTDLTAISDPSAAQFWRSLNTDLETAIAAELADRIDPAGAVVTVEVDELSLANAYVSRFQRGDSRLNGRVDLTDPASGLSIGTYDVSITSREAARYLPVDANNVIRVSPTSAEFYQGLVRAFATAVGQSVRSSGT